jgi:AraC-like DNA-binding protein
MSRLVQNEVFRRLCRAREFIRENHAEPLRLELIAQQAAMSPHHFLRSFQLAFHETPHDYLTRTRLHEAQELLARGQASVTEACFAVGFSSLGSFSSLFRRHTGLPPSHFVRRVYQVKQTPGGLARLWIPHCFLSRFSRVPVESEAKPLPR